MCFSTYVAKESDMIHSYYLMNFIFEVAKVKSPLPPWKSDILNHYMKGQHDHDHINGFIYVSMHSKISTLTRVWLLHCNRWVRDLSHQNNLSILAWLHILTLPKSHVERSLVHWVNTLGLNCTKKVFSHQSWKRKKRKELWREKVVNNSENESKKKTRRKYHYSWLGIWVRSNSLFVGFFKQTFKNQKEFKSFIQFFQNLLKIRKNLNPLSLLGIWVRSSSLLKGFLNDF